MSERKPLTVQSDRTIFLEVDNPQFRAARDVISKFAELIRSPEHIHTYRMHRLTIWQAVASGETDVSIIANLQSFANHPLTPSLVGWIQEEARRAKLLRLEKDPHGGSYVLRGELSVIRELFDCGAIRAFCDGEPTETGVRVRLEHRGELKRAVAKLGYAIRDWAGYTDGEPLKMALFTTTKRGAPLRLRTYQEGAVEAFFAGEEEGGSGVIVLPCGSGKTLVGLAVMARLQTHTLIVTTSTTAVEQWIGEIHDKLDIDPNCVAAYTSKRKSIGPITVTTYQMLSYHKDGSGVHLDQLNGRPWGLVVYDEVHLLPAPVFRLTASLQATRRLGLTATLVREDGLEDEVFTLVGPRKVDVPWRDLEATGHIATTRCFEILVDMPDRYRLLYAGASSRQKQRIAAENPAKVDVVATLLRKHVTDSVLVIGEYIEQLRQIASVCDAPLLTGSTPLAQRQWLFDRFRSGDIRVLVVSKVANVAIDLPDATVGIQVSGSFGSRQEEAQRIGRLLRPKRDGRQARFYTIVSRNSIEQERARHRQLFLVEQGYSYEFLAMNDHPEGGEENDAPSRLSQ